MRKTVLMTALLAVMGCSGPTVEAPPERPDRSVLIAERVAMLDRANANGFNIPKLKCPARTVSAFTAETMLLMWVNDRSDLVQRANLRLASDDMITAFQTCGASMDQLVNEMQQSEDTLMQGLAVAILKEGRGLS